MDFNKLYNDHYDQIKRTAKSFLRNEEDALDAAQDTFLKAYESLDSYDGSASVSTWLTQICINTCRDKLRKRKTEGKHVVPITQGNEHLLDSKEDKSDPMLLMDAAEAENSIYCFFLQMPDNLRQALMLRYNLELSYKDIAEEMGIPLNTAKTWVRRGRTQLLQTISPQ